MSANFPDLSYEENQKVWSIACKLGVDVNKARKILEAEEKTLAILEQPLQKVEQEEEPQEEEESEGEEPAESDLDLQVRIREGAIRDQKLRILAKLEKKLDDEDKQEKAQDDLVKFIKSDPIVEELVRNYCGLLLSFSRMGEDGKPMVDRVEIVIQRSKDEKIVKVTPKLLDKNGKDIGFDSKGVMLRQGDND